MKRQDNITFKQATMQLFKSSDDTAHNFGAGYRQDSNSIVGLANSSLPSVDSANRPDYIYDPIYSSVPGNIYHRNN